MNSLQKDQLEFMTVMGSARFDWRNLFILKDGLWQEHKNALALAWKLISEEVNDELLPLLENLGTGEVPVTAPNMVALTDHIVDSIYVLMQLANTLNLPIQEAWDEVHRSNMAKAPNGVVLRRPGDGKVLKPAGWQPPDLAAVLRKHLESEETGDPTKDY
jgi:hypothetical protein